MKSFKYLVAAFLIVNLTACNNNEDPAATHKNLLPTSLINNPHTLNGVDSAALKQLPTLDFADSSHSFGSVHDGEVVTYDFAFKNNGAGPLIISGAAGSCGCTVADFPHEAVAPGQGGTMKVKFNSSGKFGHVEKMVTITSNARQGTEHVFIQADVVSDKKTN